MASICVHRAPRTPPDSAPRHIRSRGDLQEESQLAIHGCAGPASPFPANLWFARSSLYKVSRPDIHGSQRPDTGFLAILQSPVPHVLLRHVSVHSSGPMRFADSEWDIKYLIHRASDYVSEPRGMDLPRSGDSLFAPLYSFPKRNCPSPDEILHFFCRHL